MSTISIKKAAIINFVAKYSNVIIQLIINSILARLILPEEFGIISIIMVFTSFFNILADMGIGPAIIQNKELKEKNISDIFKFTIMVGIVLGIGFAVFSYGIAAFYGNKVYIALGRVLAFAVLFNILNMVPYSILLRNKQFKIIGITTVTINIIVGIITIILALNGASYYALVINTVLVSLFTFVINLYNSKMKLLSGYSNESIMIIKNYSMYQFGFNFVNYFSRNLDNLLIGKVLGQTALGYYDKAYKLMLYPLQNLTFVITPVLHPILSDYQHDTNIIYDYFKKVVKVLSLIGVFVTVIAFVCSKELVLILFGSNWLDSIPAFKVLSVSIWVQMISSSTGSIFQATGNTKYLFKCGLITSACTVIFILLGVLGGTIELVALGVAIAFYINFITILWILIKQVFNKRIFDFLRIFKSSIIILIIMIIPYIFIQINIGNPWISAIIKGIIGLVGYLVGILVSGEYKLMKVLISRTK